MDGRIFILTSHFSAIAETFQFYVTNVCESGNVEVCVCFHTALVSRSEAIRNWFLTSTEGFSIEVGSLGFMQAFLPAESF